MRAALAAGWRRRDLWWERLQERANRNWVAGDRARALTGFRFAYWLSLAVFPRTDPRRATSLANAAFAARARSASERAQRTYRAALNLWTTAPATLEALHIQRRARSSLFHLRMEAKHWDTYSDNMKTRLGKIMAESEACLAALSRGEAVPHRLYSRWLGEKPSVFDDTRKVLAACLLIASDAPPDR